MSESAGTVLITGAAGGLGRAIARRFAADGHAVVCLDRDEGNATSVAEEVLETGAEATAYGLDITDEAALAALREQLSATGRLPRCVINAAGILDRGNMASTDATTFRRVVDVNLTGAYLITRTFADDLVDSGRGRVVNIASHAGTTGYPFPAYAASKAALINLTRSVLVDFWGTGVTANAVCPGAMDTPMLDRSANDAFVRKTPTRKVVTPEEVAGVCAFLASGEAGCLNGQSIVVDGGATSVFRYVDEEF